MRPNRVSGGTKVRAAVLTNYFEVSRAVGLDPLVELRKAGLTRMQLSNRDQQLPSDAVVKLLEISAEDSGCENFGLRLAEARQLSNFGIISLLISHQRTLRDVLHTIGEYRHVLNEALAIHVETAGKTTVVREEVVTDYSRPSRQATELAIGVLFQMCRALLASRWIAHSVNFTHPSPTDLTLHRHFFQCRLKFDSDFNGIVCPTDCLDIPNPMADPVMAGYAQRFIETLPIDRHDSTVLEVRKAIYLLLPMGRATIEQVSASLGMNPRSLQRRLDESGETFSALTDAVRRELALRYMQNPRYTLSRIAEQLGYSQASSFTRWFLAQFGESPARWRQRQLPRRRITASPVPGSRNLGDSA